LSSFEAAPITSDREANQLEFSLREVLRPTTCIGAQRCPTMNRPLAAPSKQNLARSTLALRWRASSCQRSRLLKSQPSAGVRRTIGNIDFDFGVSYFLYPGEISASPGTDYWQVAIRADKRIDESFRIAGGLPIRPEQQGSHERCRLPQSFCTAELLLLPHHRLRHPPSLRR
jgi:hypothetical protein